MGSTTTVQPSQIIDSSGVGGEAATALIDSVVSMYPEKLQFWQSLPKTPKLTEKLTEKDFQRAAKIAGHNRRGLALEVRGGEYSEDEAVVTYAAVDSEGRVWKGGFPYNDLSTKGESEDHVSQLGSFQASAAADLARRNEEQRLADSEAATQIDDLQARLDEAERKLAEKEDGGEQEPTEPTPPAAGYESWDAAEIIERLKTVDRAKAVEVIEYEEARKGRTRSTIVSAAQDRISEIDGAVDENVLLRQRIAELEAQATGGGDGGNAEPKPAGEQS